MFSWSNSTRFAGIQYTTNFAVKPNLVTYPLLDFRGKSELPSSIEIFSNSIPIYNAKAHIGDFDITNIPVITGRGDLIVKTQDITGKVETITILLITYHRAYYVPGFHISLTKQVFKDKILLYIAVLINI